MWGEIKQEVGKNMSDGQIRARYNARYIWKCHNGASKMVQLEAVFAAKPDD